MCSSSRRSTSSARAITRARSCTQSGRAPGAVAGQLVRRARRLLGDEPGLRPRRAHGLPPGRRYRVHVVSQRLPARARRRSTGSGPRFGAAALPEGIDCQRCHGPGQAHVEAVRSGDKKAIVLAIVNPGKLDRDRQLEACMQCHLESTSSPLPFRIQRYEQPPFSYTPGKPLSDYFMHFDHAPGTPRRDDKFEIAGGAYRLRKSACFQRSADDLPHVPQPARCPARSDGGRAAGRGVPELPPGHASGRSTRGRGARSAARPASTATCRSGEPKTPFTWS